MMKTLTQTLLMLLVFTFITGVGYPAIVWALGQLLWPERANGSLVKEGDITVGSSLVGQKFENQRYFFSRPSGSDYKAVPSLASNLGPTSAVLKELIAKRRSALAAMHGVSPERVPADLITRSASGLDPHISPNAAFFQVARVAKERRLSVQAQARLKALVQSLTEAAQWEMFGDARVNVLALNRAVDAMFGKN